MNLKPDQSHSTETIRETWSQILQMIAKTIMLEWAMEQPGPASPLVPTNVPAEKNTGPIADRTRNVVDGLLSAGAMNNSRCKASDSV